MNVIQSYFSSWYGKMWIMLLLAAASSFLITFYTTALSVPWSLTLGKHGLIFLFSFVLLLMAIIPIGFVVYRLDANSYLREHVLLRYLIQFVLLTLLLGALALKVVYVVYFVFFGVDLQQAEYFERDYVVVLFCLIMVQVYYAIRKKHKLRAFTLRRVQVNQKWLLYRDELVDGHVKNEAVIQQQLEAILLDKERLILHYEAELLELKTRKQKLRSCHELLCEDEQRIKVCIQEISQQIMVMIGVENERVRITQVSYFYLRKGASSLKLVNVRLLDGRDGTVDIESLAKVEKLWPNLLLRSSREKLIQLLAIKDIVKKDNGYLIELYGAEQETCKVAPDVYDKLLKLREEWVRLNPQREITG